VGWYSLSANTTGASNVSMGAQSLQANTTGSSNAGFGWATLVSNTTGVNNTAVGTAALFSNTIGTSNVAVGNVALYNNITGTNNVAVGQNAMYLNTAGHSNVALGDAAGYAITTGVQNTLIGNNAGNSGTNNLTTGSNNTIIGYLAAASSSTASNVITLGNSSIATIRAQVTSITALSDERDKTAIEPLAVGLDFINGLKPVKFEWNMRDGGKVGVADAGFIAQDLIAAEDATGLADHLQLTYRDNPEKLEATQGRLIPVLVKAIQELSAEVKDLKSQLGK
jgi:hypothetical protein